MKIVEGEKVVSRQELTEMSQKMGGLVKAVVDIEKKVMIVDADLHADQEAELLSRGSNQDNLWGINLYPEERDDFIEYDSMINIRPRQGNKSRGVEDENVRKKINDIVDTMVV